MTLEVQQYINQQKSAGVADAQIRQTLVQQGWAQVDLDQAFGVISTGPVVPQAPLTTNSPTGTTGHKWLKIIGVVVLVFVILIAIIVFFALSATSAPTNAARTFVQDMANNQPDQAYSLTSQAFHQQNSPNILSGLLTQYPDITKISDITLNNRTVTNNTAEISGTVTTSTGTYPVDVKLINESGGWKVYSFHITFSQIKN